MQGFLKQKWLLCEHSRASMLPGKHRDLRKVAVRWKIDKLNSASLEGSYTDHSQHEPDTRDQSRAFSTLMESRLFQSAVLYSKLFCLKKTDLP